MPLYLTNQRALNRFAIKLQSAIKSLVQPSLNLKLNRKSSAVD